MTTQTIQTRRGEQGFTLVELAVVMIIIGLLIGGILKGQELIANAELASTVTQIKGIDGATSTFRDKYSAVPGDMGTAGGANGRLPAAGCGGACANGNGDGRLTGTTVFGAPAGEAVNFFQHLAAADLLTGIAFDGTGSWGDIYPEADAGGGFVAAYSPGNQALGLAAANTVSSGHYLTIQFSPAAAAAGNTLTPNQAQRIDTKLDDGNPTTGSVFGNGGANCGAAAGYNEATDADSCDVAIRIQG